MADNSTEVFDQPLISETTTVVVKRIFDDFARKIGRVIVVNSANVEAPLGTTADPVNTVVAQPIAPTEYDARTYTYDVDKNVTAIQYRTGGLTGTIVATKTYSRDVDSDVTGEVWT